MRNSFLVLTQWSQASLKCLRNSCLNVSPLFQPMAFPAETNLTTALAFSRELPRTQGGQLPSEHLFGLWGLLQRRSCWENVKCSQLPRMQWIFPAFRTGAHTGSPLILSPRRDQDRFTSILKARVKGHWAVASLWPRVAPFPHLPTLASHFQQAVQPARLLPVLLCVSLVT